MLIMGTVNFLGLFLFYINIKNLYNKKINDKHKKIVDKYKTQRYNEFNDNR